MMRAVSLMNVRNTKRSKSHPNSAIYLIEQKSVFHFMLNNGR